MNQIEGFTFQEIANTLGKPAKMIEKRAERAMKKLKAIGTRERARERERERGANNDEKEYF